MRPVPHVSVMVHAAPWSSLWPAVCRFATDALIKSWIGPSEWEKRRKVENVGLRKEGTKVDPESGSRGHLSHERVCRKADSACAVAYHDLELAAIATVSFLPKVVLLVLSTSSSMYCTYLHRYDRSGRWFMDELKSKAILVL